LTNIVMPLDGNKSTYITYFTMIMIIMIAIDYYNFMLHSKPSTILKLSHFTK